jgi:hypothetical protein
VEKVLELKEGAHRVEQCLLLYSSVDLDYTFPKTLDIQATTMLQQSEAFLRSAFTIVNYWCEGVEKWVRDSFLNFLHTLIVIIRALRSWMLCSI